MELRSEIDVTIDDKLKDLWYYVEWTHDSLGVDEANDVIANLIITLQGKMIKERDNV